MALFQQSENEHTIEVWTWNDGDGADTFRYGLDPWPTERRVDIVTCANSDTAPHTLEFQLVNPSNDSVRAWSVVVPAGSGFAQPLVAGLPPLIATGLSGIVFPARWTWRVGLLGTLPSGKTVTAFAFGGA